MPTSFTLDTNCIIDVDQGQSSAADVLRLTSSAVARDGSFRSMINAQQPRDFVRSGRWSLLRRFLR